MVVINDVVPILGSKNHGNEVFAEELLTLALAFGPPLLALSRDLAHANRDLRRAEIRDRYRPEKRFADVNHGVLLQLSETADALCGFRSPALLQMVATARARNACEPFLVQAMGSVRGSTHLADRWERSQVRSLRLRAATCRLPGSEGVMNHP